MTDGAASVVTVREFTGVLARGVRVIVGATVVGAVAGAGLLATQPSRYVTEALVEVRPIVSREDDPNLDLSRQINPETEVVIGRSLRVAERALALRTAADELGGADLRSAEVTEAAASVTVDPTQARRSMGSLQVSIVGDSTILRFQASGQEPAQAQALAQSSALAYLEFRRAEALAGNSDSRQRLQAREAELLAELAALGTFPSAVVAGGWAADAGAGDGAPVDGGAAAGDGDGADDGAGAGGAGVDGDAAAGADGDGDGDQGAVDAAGPEVLAYGAISKRQELTAIGNKYANLEALSIDPGVVLTDAAVPTTTQGLPPLAGPVMGAVLGLIGALAAVFVLDRTDDRLRSSRVELGALGVPLLGTAPVAAKRAPAPAPGDYVNTPPRGPDHRLHGRQGLNLDSEGRTVVLVAGVNNAAAATTVAANMAVTAARAGRRTLVMGADLRSDRLGVHFDLPPAKGLSDVVLDGVSLADSIRSVPGIENLSVLGAGTRVEHPADVLQNEALDRLVAAVGVDYDLVIVEAAPILQVADAVDVAPLCHGSIVVVDASSETRGAIADSVAQLRSVGSTVVGVVVADAA